MDGGCTASIHDKAKNLQSKPLPVSVGGFSVLNFSTSCSAIRRRAGLSTNCSPTFSPSPFWVADHLSNITKRKFAHRIANCIEYFMLSSSRSVERSARDLLTAADEIPEFIKQNFCLTTCRSYEEGGTSFGFHRFSMKTHANGNLFRQLSDLCDHRRVDQSSATLIKQLKRIRRTVEMIWRKPIVVSMFHYGRYR